jgi:outer membrane protein
MMGENIIKKTIPIIIVFAIFLTLTPAMSSAQDLPLLTLEECINKGLKNDPSLVQSGASLKKAKNSIWSSYGSFLPYLSFGLDYNWSSRPSQYDVMTEVIGDTIEVTTPLYTKKYYYTSLSLNQNLFNGFSDYFGWKANGYYKKSSQKSYDNQVLSTIYNLKSSYFNVLKSMKLADVQKKAMERSEEQLRITETRYELGSAALSDVLKARVSNGEAKLNLINAENNYKISMAQLNQLVGEKVSRQYRVDTTASVREVDYTLDNSIEYALGNNPLLQAYKYSMDSYKNSVRSAWGGYLPSLDFRYSVSYSQPESFEFGEMFKKNHNYGYGISLSFNIFDRFYTRNQISNAKADYNTAEFNYHNYRNGLELEVTESYLNLEKAQLSMEVARDKLASALEDYKLAQEKYTLGAATILDLLDAELSLKTAESDVIESEYNLNLAVANLEKALGITEY